MAVVVVSTATPLLPPVGNMIQPLFARLPASHAATDEVTSYLFQPRTPVAHCPVVAPPTLVDAHEEFANGRLFHVTVDCRKQRGAGRGTRQREGVSARVPHAVVRGMRASSRSACAHLIPWNDKLAKRGVVAHVGHVVVEPGAFVRHETGTDERAQVELDQEGGRVSIDG